MENTSENTTLSTEAVRRIANGLEALRYIQQTLPVYEEAGEEIPADGVYFAMGSVLEELESQVPQP